VREGEMIGYDDVLPLLSAACPTYPQSPEAAAVEVENGHYVNIGHFVAHLLRLSEHGETESFPQVFAMIEWILHDGDEHAWGLVTNGFLEDLAGDGMSETHRRATVARFRPWLGPRARANHRIRAALSPRAGHDQT
jgi:hypothetical protein